MTVWRRLRAALVLSDLPCLVLLLLVGGVCAADAAALTVTVTAAGTAHPPSTIRASMRRVDGDAPVRVLELPVGTSTVVENAGSHTWEITAASSTLWSAPVYASGTEAVTLHLWPLGVLAGKVGGGGGSSASAGELVVSFAPSEESSAGSAPSGTVACPIGELGWRCSIPAGTVDLRFHLTGFATEFRWGVKVGDHTDVGTLDFTPGASVYGKVQLLRKSKTARLTDIEISLTPANVDASHRNAPRYSTTADLRGFFQVRGLRPGTYDLRARSKSSELLSDTRTVTVLQQTNAALKEPLVLARPSRLAVRITPALDTQQRRWQVLLLKVREVAGRADVVDQSLASPDGEWSLRRALPGEYRLEIQQEDGAEWKTEEFTLRPEDGDRILDVVVSSQRVAGRVRLGGRPIAARVRMGDENGPALLADRNGDFEGELPPMAGEETTFLVTADTPHVQRTLTLEGEREPDGRMYFRIELPATTISGRTIQEDGSAVPAIVTLRAKGKEGDGLFEQMFSGEDGAFQFQGFDAGVYALQADAFQKASAVVDVEVTSEDSPMVDLVLRPQEQVRGFISMNGVPVAGADVYALPRDTKTSLLPQVTSDSGGRFVVTLPPGTKTYDVIVFPRGFYVTAARISRDPAKGLRVGVGQDGGALTVDVPADRTPLLLRHAGGEYPLPWVVSESGGTESTADGRRRLTIPNLEPGAYSVCRMQRCESVYVPRFATALVTLEE